MGVTGAVLVAASFALTGHTSSSDRRLALVPLLLAHLLIVAFWFGALLAVVPGDAAGVARAHGAGGRVVFRRPLSGWFHSSWWPGWPWPLCCLPNVAALRKPYGELVIAKVALFARADGAGRSQQVAFRPGPGRG